MKKGVPKNVFARLVCWLKNLQFQKDHMQYPQASPGINFWYQPKKQYFFKMKQLDGYVISTPYFRLKKLRSRT